ncbi:beta-glucosidase 4-like [Papaver somniferum]|uniref:beta-glucosidase 4-like n=1 Tax=Papaver somniferum TaxID=3469 RepID=UPI000E70130A|nr:beta-glucosidase 4-like [Papaver somniferum]
MATNFMDEEIPIVVSRQDFPPNFVFGVSTSAYQRVQPQISNGLGDRLPRFTDEDRELLSYSIDFLGINQYTSRFIAHAATSPDPGHFIKDQQIERIVKYPGGEAIGDKAASDWLYIVAWGLRNLLNYVAEKYQNPKIYITENGMDDEEDPETLLHKMLDDKKRVGYYKAYIAALAQAIKDGADVRGYFAWSFMDNFEWSEGYTKRFGIVYVDYKNGLCRYPKSSALWFSRFLSGDEGMTIMTED